MPNAPLLNRNFGEGFFAVDMDALILQANRQRFDPLLQAVVELFGIESCEDSSEGVVRGDAVFEFEELSKPVFFGVREAFEIGPVIDAADGSAQGDDQHVGEFMIDLFDLSRIAQRVKDC